MKRGMAVQAAVQGVLQALWVGLIPLLLAAVAMRFLVPPPGDGVRGVVAVLGRMFPVPFAVALFLIFTLIARHWRFRVPGARYASSLPAHVAPDERDGERLVEWASIASLSKAMTLPSVRRRLTRNLDASRHTELEARLAGLDCAIKEADLAKTRAAAGSVRSLAEPALAAQRQRETLHTLVAIAAAAAVALGVRSRVAESYRVVSNSMVPTFEADDQVLGRRVTYGASSLLPSRGDVLLFRSDAAPATATRAEPRPPVFVKRVIGLPGDTIAMQGEVPIINGWLVPTCVAGPYLYVATDGEGGSLQGVVVVEFLEDHAYLTLHSAPGQPFARSYLVQPGEVFVLGDSRGNSVDSRAYGEGQGAGIPLAGIVARADRFLVGTHRSGDADFTRIFQPITQVEHRLHVEGMSADALQQGIASCLSHRPTRTRPPPPAAPQARATGASSDPGPT
jgi:signal peptidase I